MRAFMVLSIFAVASAAQLGYNYEPGRLITSEIMAPSVSDGSIANGVPGSYGPSVLSSGPGLGSGLTFGVPQRGVGLGGGYVGPSQLSAPVGGSQLHKEFLVFSAPEDDAQDAQDANNIAQSLKKNLRVLFIKAPENNAINNAALQLAKHATEGKTAIYVLSKQPDVSELLRHVQDHRDNINAKPEVRFIKYRTPQDAANAQRTIQQQYDNLGGTSQISDEGIAPVLNYASPLAYNAAPSGSVNTGSGDLSSPLLHSVVERKEYLPPAPL